MSTLTVDAPANNAGISLSYSLVDQVTGITQSGSTTSFTYDALGRRVNETAGGLTTVRHYSDSSDNPEWTTQQSGANLTTEIYTGSLGAGLAVTTTFKGTVRTSSMQLTDIRGHTVTTLDLDSNSVAGWSVYDSFGNPQTSQTNTNLINYSSYGQQERATNTTGLILMGARVYNPETNQFTTKDPIKGGNENPYTYPNDPINGNDFSGLTEETNAWISFMSIIGAVVMCLRSRGAICWQGTAVGVSGGALQSFNDAFEKDGKNWGLAFKSAGEGGVSAYISSKTLDKFLGQPISVAISKFSKAPGIKSLTAKERKFVMRFVESYLTSLASDRAKANLISILAPRDPIKYSSVTTSLGCIRIGY